MNGIHDLGGMHGFGPVEREANEPPFHAPWEATMVAIQNAVCRTVMNIDEFRHGIERMAPAAYLETSYYEHWLDGIARVLVEKGVVSAAELDRRSGYFAEHADEPAQVAVAGGVSVPPVQRRDVVRPPVPERFVPGDRVITRRTSPRGHTRLPRYARGRRGVVERIHGTHVFPDAHAHGLGEQPQPLYSVRFDAHELWGDSAEPTQTVSLDLWESYLRSDED
jgi:nitrile hydratase subunit beta